jgi:ParB/RepB/Spo0J family partition protein
VTNILNIPLRCITVKPDRLRRLRPEKVDEIAESIRTRGQLINPITLRVRFRHSLPHLCSYTLNAGWHRLEAVRKLGYEKIAAIILKGRSDSEQAQLTEIDENLVRADLTPAERKLHVARRAELYEAKHGKAKAIGARAANEKMGRDASAKLADAFTTDTAKRTGKSKRGVQRDVQHAKAVKVLDQIVGTLLDTGDEIEALSKLPEDEQRKLAERARAGERVSAKTRAKQIKRQERERTLGEKQQALPTRKYGVIVADPEWRFEPWSHESGMDRAAANHYPTSCTEVIASRDVASIAAKLCVLFLWATNPMLPHALLVMAAWGFDYKSHYVWGKDKAGTGYWNREKHELLLIGTRGDVPCPAPGEQRNSLIMAPVGEHSAKPECFLEMIEQYFPTLPKIELNRRGPPRPGWDAWGNPSAETSS